VLDARRLDRRTFVADLGKGAFALAVLSVAAACTPSAVGTGRPSLATSPSSTPVGSAGSGAGASPSASAAGSSAPPAGGGDLAWTRVNLGFVSAYILARGGEAAIVDTGTAGSAGAIEQALGSVGLGWANVAHLVLTHRHDDHQGSAADVLERAPDAAGYAGAEDISGITVPRTLTAVGDGDRVFDLAIVTTPGHTAGSICVHDPVAGILVAGDALRIEGGKPTLPGAQFTEDMDTAKASVAKLGALAFETLLVGHGEPIEAGASAAVAALAAQS
jgi:glyoxylase-like metal-dependent hydrolase (beta-lactamase superfamily II)